MEVESVHDFLVACSKEVFRTLFAMKSKELQKKEDINIIKGIDTKSFYYTKSINCYYDDINAKTVVSFSKEFVDILIEYSDEEIKKYYDQLDLNIMLSNFIGVLLYVPCRKLRDIYHAINFDLPQDTKITEIFQQNKVLLFSKNSEPLVYLGITYDS